MYFLSFFSFCKDKYNWPEETDVAGDIVTGQWGHNNYQRNWYCVTTNRTLFFFKFILCICVDLLHHHGEFDSLVLELEQLFSATQWKTAILCWQLPNVMFLYIILHMAIKLSRHQCQRFAFSYHRQREIII